MLNNQRIYGHPWIYSIGTCITVSHLLDVGTYQKIPRQLGCSSTHRLSFLNDREKGISKPSSVI
jgi:hypothetical protein